MSDRRTKEVIYVSIRHGRPRNGQARTENTTFRPTPKVPKVEVRREGVAA